MALAAPDARLEEGAMLLEPVVAAPLVGEGEMELGRLVTGVALLRALLTVTGMESEPLNPRLCIFEGAEVWGRACCCICRCISSMRCGTDRAPVASARGVVVLASCVGVGVEVMS